MRMWKPEALQQTRMLRSGKRVLLPCTSLFQTIYRRTNHRKLIMHFFSIYNSISISIQFIIAHLCVFANNPVTSKCNKCKSRTSNIGIIRVNLWSGHNLWPVTTKLTLAKYLYVIIVSLWLELFFENSESPLNTNLPKENFNNYRSISSWYFVYNWLPYTYDNNKWYVISRKAFQS